MEIPYNEYQNLQLLALHILNSIDKRERSYVEEINKTCKAIVLLLGSGSDKLKSDITLSVSVIEVTNLADLISRGIENWRSDSLCSKK